MNLQEAIQNAAVALKSGKTLLYPTDTVWGLGCDPTNAAAVEKIYDIKNREAGKSLILLVNSDQMLNRMVQEVPAVAWDIIDHATRATTIIYPQTSKLIAHLAHTDGSIAIRMVKEGFAAQLMQRTNLPLVSTSANISGEPTPKTYAEISDELRSRVDHIVPEEFANRGTGKASAIIRLKMNGEVEIIRK